MLNFRDESLGSLIKAKLVQKRSLVELVNAANLGPIFEGNSFRIDGHQVGNEERYLGLGHLLQPGDEIELHLGKLTAQSDR
jgi:hypothetical protein